MKISTDDQRAIGLIMICIGVLCFLIGLAGHLKENYHFRGEISATGFTASRGSRGDRHHPDFVFLEKKTRLRAIVDGGLETAVPCRALAGTISLREKSDPAAIIF